MASSTNDSARRFAIIALVLVVMGIGMMVLGGLESRLEVLTFSGVLLLLAAPVVGVIALVLAAAGGARSGTVALAVLALLAPVVALTWLLFPAFRSARIVARQRLCMQHLKSLSMAMLTYAQDWNEHYPPAQRWCDAIRPYVRSLEDYRCPDARHLRCGYAMNARLDGFKLSDLAQPSKTAMLYDATGGWNLSGGRELIARRHGNTANFAFADGHVKYRYRMNDLRWEAR